MNLIETLLPPSLYQELEEIKFYYEGFHNITFCAFLKSQKVQIRLKKNNLTSHLNECHYAQNNDDYFYCSEEIMVRKWSEGNTYLTNKRNDYLLLDTLQKFWKQDSSQLTKFNWNYYPISDPHFQFLVKKYENEESDFIHGDLAFKNIILKNSNEIKLIDLEWISKGSKYFDIAYIFKHISLNKKQIISYLNLDQEKFEDYHYMQTKFSEAAYLNTYNKIITEQKRIHFDFLTLVKKELPFEILSSLKDLRFYYDGYHNYCYKASYQNKDVLIKLTKKTYSTLKEEIMVLRLMGILIYNNDNLLIKEFFPGKIYQSTKKNDYFALDELDKLWSYKIDAPKFYWFTKEIKDSRYRKLVAQYEQKDQVLMHGDIAPYNLILSGKKVKIIDFDFVRYGNKYFDIVHFMKFTSLNVSEVVSYLGLDLQTLKDFEYLVEKFDAYIINTRYPNFDWRKGKKK